MKPQYKFIRTVFAAAMGAALWAGCASDQSFRRVDPSDQPVDMTEWHANTHPEWLSGTRFNVPNPLLMPNSLVEPSVINEAAGASVHR